MEPCAVIASACENILPLTIIEGILGSDSMPGSIDVLENIKAYPWQLSTKYYDASVHLCAMERKTIGNREFADTVNAIVLCFDSHSVVGLSNAEQWLPFLDEFNSAVKILVCDYCPESVPGNKNSAPGADRVTAVKWCIKNGFELVELNSQVNDSEEGDLEDDFPETVGIPRIKEALGAHIWPNMIRKDSHGSRNSNQLSFPEQRGGSDETATSKSAENANDSSEEEADDGMFEALFQQLSTMKSKANNLHTEERRDFAEKMTVAFWKAIGGDESEIDELNSDVTDKGSP